MAETPDRGGVTLGGRLRRMRLQAGLSQSALERKSGIPKSMLSRYENDHLLPSVRTLRRLAKAIGVAPHSLLEDGDEIWNLDSELIRRGIRLRSHEEIMQIADIVVEAVRSADFGSGRRSDRSST